MGKLRQLGSGDFTQNQMAIGPKARKEKRGAVAKGQPYQAGATKTPKQDTGKKTVKHKRGPQIEKEDILLEGKESEGPNKKGEERESR